MRVPDPGSGIRARGEGTRAAPAAVGHSCRPRSRGAPRRKCWRWGSLGAVTGAQTRSAPGTEGTEEVGGLGPPGPGSGEGGRGARIPHLPAVPGGSPRRGLVHRRLHPSTSRRDCSSAAAAALRAGPEPGSRLRPAPAGQRAREHRVALSSPAPLGGRAAAAGPSRLARVSCQPAVSPGSAAPPPPLLPPPPLPHPRPPGEPPPPPRRDHRPRRLGSPRRLRRPPHSTGPARLGPRRARNRPPPGRRSPQPTIHRGSAGAGGPRPDRGGGGGSARGSERAWRGRRGAGVP